MSALLLNIYSLQYILFFLLVKQFPNLSRVTVSSSFFSSEHMEYLKGVFPKYKKNKKWLKDKQNKTFGAWVKNRVSNCLMEKHI